MNNKTIKQTHTTNVRHIPTELNYFHNTSVRVKRLRQQGNTSRLLIIGLIIWNIVLTFNTFHIPIKSNIPQFTAQENQLIMQLEDIPIEELKIN